MTQIHAERRLRFMKEMGGGAALIVSTPQMLRNNDVLHEYRQNSDLFYLSRFEEPDAALLLLPNHPEHRFVMFVRPRDPEKEVWTGHRVGVERAPEVYGADAAFPIGELEATLPKYLEGVDRLYVNLGSDPQKDHLALEMLNRTRRSTRTEKPGPSHLIDAAEILHEMRLRKDKAEIESLSRAAEISAAGHRAAMAAVRPGMFEYEIQAVLEYVFRRAGCHRWGYPSIVASGPNATVLHYEGNSRQIQDGELLLIDAAGEWGYVCADITRTFPVSGRFLPAQRRLYEIVLDAEKKAIAKATPGTRFDQVHDTALRALVEGMIGIGLLSGDPDEAIKSERYKRYYMHKTSHWLGMDVHDVGRYQAAGTPRPLEPGMVLTIEPGLYVAVDDTEAPAEYRGIGIRIEDDVLITEAGNQVLTSGVPKEVEELEALCCSKSLEPFSLQEGGLPR
jgi:Xaa-Pro aminopeptidase